MDSPAGGVDVGEPPARVLFPVADPLHLSAGTGRVDQDRIAFAENPSLAGQPTGDLPTLLGLAQGS